VKKPKAIQPTTAQLELEEQQRVQSAQLDAEENRRRKRFLSAQQGIRAFRGASLLRALPGNTSGGAVVAGRSTIPASPGRAVSSGGGRGGYRRTR
jgi:hypothetical protein